jgi:hypothetical protein
MIELSWDLVIAILCQLILELAVLMSRVVAYSYTPSMGYTSSMLPQLYFWDDF